MPDAISLSEFTKQQKQKKGNFLKTQGLHAKIYRNLPQKSKKANDKKRTARLKSNKILSRTPQRLIVRKTAIRNKCKCVRLNITMC